MVRGATRRSVVTIVVAALLTALSGCSTATPLARDTSVSPSPSPSSPATPSATPTSSPAAPRPEKVTQRRPGWALDRIDQRRPPLDRRFTTTGQGQGVTVYVVDGLFDVSNPELGGRAVVGLKRGRACSLEDGVNHGLFVAGLVAGRTTGVAKRAKVVLVGSSNGCEGFGGDDARATARIVRALDWVTAHAQQPAVVNLSLNAPGPAPKITAAVQRLVATGVTVVASAGNAGDDACDFPPAGLPGVITVAASTESDRDAGLNHGRCVDLFAPGENVTSVVDAAVKPNRLVTEEGAATSWATPLVSGTAALYLSAHPDTPGPRVKGWLRDNATRGALRGSLHGSPNRLVCTCGSEVVLTGDR